MMLALLTVQMLKITVITMTHSSNKATKISMTTVTNYIALV